MNREVLTADDIHAKSTTTEKKIILFLFYLQFSLNKSKINAKTVLHYETLEMETKKSEILI